MTISEGLNNFLDKKCISPISVERIYPENILPEYRKDVEQCLKNESIRDITSPEVKDAILKWYNKLVAIGVIQKRQSRKAILDISKAPNDNQELEASNDLKKAA